MSQKQVISKLSVSEIEGMTNAQVECRRRSFGENVLKSGKKKSIVRRFFEQLADFMTLFLLCAAVISFGASILSGDPDFTDPIVILAIVVLNAIIGTVQESRAEKALDKLKQLSAPHVTVMREGEKIKLETRELVPGDIIWLSAGEVVPADCRLLETTGCKAVESALTGESLPVDKDADVIVGSKSDVSERRNMIWSSTAIVSGSCRAVVCETGMNTQIGMVAKLLGQADDAPTPLQQRLAKTGKSLGITAIAICGVIFILGLLRGVPPLDTFMLSVSLGVAAIPEGLPAIVTAALALGVRKMAKENAIVRRLPAVETLGCATVICSDKTGTLTQNKMTVAKICGEEQRVLENAVLCCNATAMRENGIMTATGDPTEVAIVVCGLEKGVVKSVAERQFTRIREIPFSSDSKIMTTVHKSGNGYRVIVKGAPERVIERCSLNGQTKSKITEQVDTMTKKALRVLAVAIREYQTLPKGAEFDKLEFIGLIGMIDPPRENVKRAVEECRRAGVRAVMITGDNALTAKAIAEQIGIVKRGEDAKVLTGTQLDELTDRQLVKEVRDCRVFARVTPIHKVRIVKAYKSSGDVVAMTGDGINDAPALRAADIGCAMGKGGTDVAREASDMVLTDDNFSTIVVAVRRGRGIYDNIKKSVRFLLSCNIGEILTVFLASLIGLPSPILAIQLLWVNLITDSLPAIALSFESVESDVMRRKPLSPKKGMFDKSTALDLLCEGCLIGGLSLLAFSIGRTFFDVTGEPLCGRTMAFCVLSLSQLFHAFNVRTSRSLTEIGLFTNKKMCISFAVCTLLQIAVVTLPIMRSVFHTVALGAFEWLIVILLSVVPIVFCEIRKKFSGK